MSYLNYTPNCFPNKPMGKLIFKGLGFVQGLLDVEMSSLKPFYDFLEDANNCLARFTNLILSVVSPTEGLSNRRATNKQILFL